MTKKKKTPPSGPKPLPPIDETLPLEGPSRSGGIDVSTQGDTNIGGDAVGRDKIIQITPSQPSPQPGFLFLDRHKYNYPFVGRDELIKQLHTALSQVKDDEARPVVLFGLGGTGKTRLAIEYAHRFRECYPDGVYGINATADWYSQMRSLAVEIGLPHDDAQGTGLALEKFLNDHPRSLLIIDDVNDPRTLWSDQKIGLNVAELKCRVLITARGRVVGKRFQTLKIDPLSESESVKLLLNTDRYHALLTYWEQAKAEDNPDLGAAQDICRMLGNLPLAVTIAAAYLNTFATTSLSGYRSRLATESGLRAIEDAAGELLKAPTDIDYERTVSATLNMQWAALIDEDARLLLKASAFLDKREWLPCVQIALLTGLSREAKAGYPIPLETALIPLRRLSLIEERMMVESTPDPSSQEPVPQAKQPAAFPDFVRLHSLVQEFVRQQIALEDSQESFRHKLEINLVNALNDTTPLVERRQAALLLADLQWLDETWIFLFPDTMLKYMEMVARYISTNAERHYLEERLNMLVDAPKLIKLTDGERAQLLVQRAALRGQLGKATQAEADYQTAESLAGEEDTRLAARINLGRANLIRRECQRRLAKAADKAAARPAIMEDLHQAVDLCLQADGFALRYEHDPILRVHVLQQLAYTYALSSEWTSADQICQTALDWVAHITDATSRSIHLARVQETWSQVHFERGKYLSSSNDPSNALSALTAFRIAYDMVKDEIEKLREARLESYEYVLAHYNAGEILLHESRCSDCQETRLPQARDYFVAALEMAQRLKFDDLVQDAEEAIENCRTSG